MDLGHLFLLWWAQPFYMGFTYYAFFGPWCYNFLDLNKCYKACFVAKGFIQEYEINYEKTFTPIAWISFVCALLSVGATSKWGIF